MQSAFRTKAKEFHPDQNQDNKGGEFMKVIESISSIKIKIAISVLHVFLWGAEFAETKFKEVMVSYEAIKSERKNNGIK